MFNWRWAGVAILFAVFCLQTGFVLGRDSTVVLEMSMPECPTVPKQKHFASVMPTVFKHEGVNASNPTGYAWIPGDRGGETNWGISQAAWSIVRDGTFMAFPESVKNLTKSQATAIYKRVYYLPIFDSLPRSVALVAFDAEVNQNKAERFLASAVGPLTPAGIARVHCDPERAVDELLWTRLEHYSRLAQRSKANQRFLAQNWLPRLIVLRQETKHLNKVP